MPCGSKSGGCAGLICRADSAACDPGRYAADEMMSEGSQVPQAARFILTVLFALGLAGCEQLVRNHADGRMKPRRAASVAPWEVRAIDGLPAKSFAMRRGAMILGGIDEATLDQTGTTTVRVRDFKRDGKPASPLSQGSAAAITDDGYFVTSAHCLPRDPALPFLVVFDGGAATPICGLGRIVYSGWDRARGWPNQSFADFAIIQADAANLPFYRWSAPEAIQPGAPMLLVGLGQGGERAAGGEIIEHKPEDGECPPPYLQTFAFAAPMISGDSGGAVILVDGTLVGVACETVWGILANEWHSQGVRADPTWVKAIVDRDRANRSATTAPHR